MILTGYTSINTLVVYVFFLKNKAQTYLDPRAGLGLSLRRCEARHRFADDSVVA